MQRVIKIVLILITLTISSCVSKKKIIYFQDDGINIVQIKNNNETILKPNDLISITISALDIEAVKPFNFQNLEGTNKNSSGNTYLIDNKGFIEFPIIGKIKLGDLTKNQAIIILREKLSPDYIKSPTINIKITNFSITILGDVKNPGKFIIPNEKISIIEAIGLAGDLNITAIRNIQVKREESDKIKTYNLDLRSNKIFSSPAYYLQQNDVVYVKPNNAKSQSASNNKNVGLIISLSSIVISLISVLAR